MICPPFWLCRCGCGQPTAYLKYDYPRQGYKKGEYRKYVNGHNGRGKKRLKETVEKQAASISGDNHWTRRQSFSAESRKKMSESGKRRWANNPRKYDGGFPNQKDRWSPENSAWRTAVYERDGYKCQKCGRPGGSGNVLNAHHIKPWAKYPELRFELSNGMTLCSDPCHKEEGRRK